MISKFVEMAAAKKIILFVFFIVIQLSVYSQCAMCRAALETDLQSGGSAGAGINNGILYLILFPYLLFGTVGYIIYRHYKKNKLANKI